MRTSISGSNKAPSPVSDPVAAELASYNHAFTELELPWQWDAATLLELKSLAGDSDLVGTYVERKQAHLLRAYEKAFLGELVRSARERYRNTHAALS
ncbi:MAG TPA: hypothetical protein VNX02_00285 [Steroidobacteraceae bacterium]|nr:hypothetical protein [Steroidobacteraceae bacterium]